MLKLLLQRTSARALAVSAVSLAIMTLPVAGQVAATPPAAPPDLPPVEVPQAASEPAPPAPAKKPKAKAAAPPPPKARPAPAIEPTPDAASAPEPADPAVALGTFNPALDLRDMELPPGTTITTAGPVLGYRALSAMSSTKTATPIERIPQSIQVVPKDLIEDQRNLTVSEAIQNASNVQGPNSRSLGDTQLYPYTIRGFGAQAWLDGMVMPFSLGDRDALANVERIEVLKGPAAILYGGGAGAPIGGAVNIVSKLPTDTASGEIGFTYGSHDYMKPYFDLNQPLTTNGTVLLRVTGEYTAADSFIDVLEQDRHSINPTLTLTNKTDTTLTVQGRWSKSEQQSYQGLPVAGTILGDFQIDPELFIGPSDIPRGYSEVRGVTINLDHKLNDIWSANVKARWSEGGFAQLTQLATSADFGATPAIPPSTWLLGNTALQQDIEEFSVNPNAQARFSLVESRNTLLVGADYSRVRDVGLFQTDYLGSACAAFFGFGVCGFTGPTVPLTNPAFPAPFVNPSKVDQYQDFFGFDQVVTWNDVHSVYTTKGAYAQLQSTFYDRVHVLAGVRSTNVKIEQTELNIGIPQYTETDAHKILPRAGILVDLVPGLSAYASYSEGMQAVPRQLPSGESLPEFSKQREVGFKFNLGDQLTGTVAYFEIDRDNVVVNLGLGNIALANQEAHGYEADILWQPDRNWQVLASYGFTNAEFADGLLGVAKGNTFAGVPEHSGRLWIDYLFDGPLNGWSAGAGIYAASSQFVDSANLYKVEGFYTIDAKIAYETASWRAALNVKNLTGEDYFVPYEFLVGQVAPGDERAFYGTFAYKY